MSSTPLDHLTPQDLDAIGEELDAIRDEVAADLGEDDRAYIRRVIVAQRLLEAGGRVSLMVGILPPAWMTGTALLSAGKILENMELGHNIMHGQWDWMQDPKIHSTTWEWDNVTASEGWKKSHNYEHHTYTNVLGKDRDLGYTLLRLEPEQPWRPYHWSSPSRTSCWRRASSGASPSTTSSSTRHARVASRGSASPPTSSAWSARLASRSSRTT
jgi:linoleoyl-CoA desaturase